MCQLKFGSWTYDGSKVELRLDENGFDLSTYIPNGEWEIKSVHAERHILFYKCCVEPYFDIVFSFEIRRKTLFYGFNLIVPCIAITLLTIIGFTYPAEAGEKMSIQINVLLSICIFQNYVSEMSPPTSESVPFLGTYFLCTILTVSLSVVGTVVIVNVHNRTTKTHKMGSKMIKIFLQKMPWLLFMRKPQKRYKPKEYALEVPEKYKQPRETLRDLLINREKLPVKKLVQLLILERILDDVKIINSISKNEFEDEIEAREWQYMGIVFDRIALYVCASFVVISTIALFLSAAVG
uniref:Uncharacterized protein n=1 Tax=Panagrolaimus sp. PS1159 TaxID=55785 RepID=A0AC35FYL1_9BILA